MFLHVNFEWGQTIHLFNVCVMDLLIQLNIDLAALRLDAVVIEGRLPLFIWHNKCNIMFSLYGSRKN